MTKTPYWIKERTNPQFSRVYYVACGQLPVRKAKAMENTLHGANVMLRFSSEKEYTDALVELKVMKMEVLNQEGMF